MAGRIDRITVDYKNDNCAIGTKLSVELVDIDDPSYTMVVKNGQRITCPRRKPAGGDITPSGNILTVEFSGCEGCNAYKPSSE